MVKKNFLQKTLILFCIFLFLLSFNVLAEDLVGSSFVVRDPIIGTWGGFSSSSIYNLYQTGHTLLSGTGSSATYIGRYGFLYFPFLEVGNLIATQNGTDAVLDWGASTAGLGWNISGYNVGIANVSGGPYTMTYAGNVNTYTYENLDPGQYCFIIETLDAFGDKIGESNEDCLDIIPVITFSISTNNINFGNLRSNGPRYANTSTGSNIDVPAHTISAGSNAPFGYILTYRGPTLTSGIHTINTANNISGDGTIGTEQFGISLGTNGNATIPLQYRQTGPNRTFVANSTEEIASTNGITTSEDFDLHYLVNISPETEAGEYKTNITYTLTGQF